MAYSILVDDIFETTIVSKLFLQEVQTVLHWKVTSAPTANMAWSQINSYLTTMSTSALFNAYLGCLSQDVVVKELRGQIVAPTRRPVVVFPMSVTGTVAVTAGAANISAFLVKRTDRITHRKVPTGKGGVGGVHVPGIPNTAYVNGLITGAFQTTLNAFGTLVCVPDALADGAITPVLWHRGASGVSTDTDELVQCVAEPTSRVMRRRTVGLGI